jgi:hypothetical protein
LGISYFLLISKADFDLSVADIDVIIKPALSAASMWKVETFPEPINAILFFWIYI